MKIYQFKAKDFKLNAYTFCMGNISKDFTVNNMKTTVLYRYLYDVSVDYESIDFDEVLDIDKRKSIT